MKQNTFKCQFCGSSNSLSSLSNGNSFKNNNPGSLSYNLTINEMTPFPKTLYGIKALIKDKNKALLMIDKIQTDFNLSDWDVQQWRQELFQREKENIESLKEQADMIESNKPFSKREE